MNKESDFETYLALLALVQDRLWRITVMGNIRDEEGRCPICALGHELSQGKIDYKSAAWHAVKQMGMPEGRALNDVMEAADDPNDCNRQRLLEALDI